MNLDLLVVDKIFMLEENFWSMRDAWLTETLIHKWGRMLLAAMIVLILVAWLGGYRFNFLQSYRFGLSYLLVAVIINIITISILKSFTETDCP